MIMCNYYFHIYCRFSDHGLFLWEQLRKVYIKMLYVIRNRKCLSLQENNLYQLILCNFSSIFWVELFYINYIISLITNDNKCLHFFLLTNYCCFMELYRFTNIYQFMSVQIRKHSSITLKLNMSEDNKESNLLHFFSLVTIYEE